MKRNKEKGSRDFPCSVGNVLAAGVSRAPSARALRRHVFSVLTRARSSDVRFSEEHLTPPAHTHGPLNLVFSNTQRENEIGVTTRPRQHPDSNLILALLSLHSAHGQRHVLFERFPTRSFQHVRSAPRRAPFWGVASSLRQSGADTPPSLSFSRHRERSFFTSAPGGCAARLSPITFPP